MTDTTIDTKFKLEGVDGAIATVQAFAEASTVLPPGYDAAPVKLQDDESLVEMVAMRLAPHGDAGKWLDDTGETLKDIYRNTARSVLAIVDEMQCQRLFKITMPKSTDDAATLRAMFVEPDPGLGPQLRDLDDETGAFDVLNEHFRKQRI